MLGTQTLDALCECAMKISGNVAGRQGASWIEKEASIIFAKLCMTCISLLKLVPDSSFYSSSKGFQIWDVGSASTLSRNIMETYFALCYIINDWKFENEAELKQLVWEYHETFERLEIIRTGIPNSKSSVQITKILEKRRYNLEKASAFQKLNPELKKEILKGERFKLVSRKIICEKSGISKKYYDSEFKNASNFTHTSPLSLKLMDSYKIESPEGRALFKRVVDSTAGFVALALRDYTILCPDQKDELPAEIKKIITLWEGILRWEQNESFNEYTLLAEKLEEQDNAGET